MKKILFTLALLISFSSFGQDNILINNRNNTFQITYKSEIKKGKIIVDEDIEIENINKLVKQSINLTFKGVLGESVDKKAAKKFKKVKSIRLTIKDDCESKMNQNLKEKCAHSTFVVVTYKNSRDKNKFFFDNNFERVGKGEPSFEVF